MNGDIWLKNSRGAMCLFRRCQQIGAYHSCECNECKGTYSAEVTHNAGFCGRNFTHAEQARRWVEIAVEYLDQLMALERMPAKGGPAQCQPTISEESLHLEPSAKELDSEVRRLCIEAHGTFDDDFEVGLENAIRRGYAAGLRLADRMLRAQAKLCDKPIENEIAKGNDLGLTCACYRTERMSLRAMGDKLAAVSSAVLLSTAAPTPLEKWINENWDKPIKLDAHGRIAHDEVKRLDQELLPFGYRVSNASRFVDGITLHLQPIERTDNEDQGIEPLK